MLTVLLIGFLAISVDAAPRTQKELHQPLATLADNVNLETAETNKKSRQFWQEFDKETKIFEERFDELSRSFPDPVLHEGIDGDKYKIIISAPNFKQNEIKVKTDRNKLIISGRHEGADTADDFLYLIPLPDNVEEGTWTYENDILTFQFPLTTTMNGERKSTEPGDDD